MTLRLDRLLVCRRFATSRARARRLIEAGAISVDGHVIHKPAQSFPDTVHITATESDIPYVSRGGIKLETALDHFNLSPKGLYTLDVGASTGGFTDLLLQRGAIKVTAIDVGRHQLHPKLRSHPDVASYEQTDVRTTEPASISGPFDWVVADISFLAMHHFLPILQKLAIPGGRLLVLVKPQFELSPHQLPKSGVVRDPIARVNALRQVQYQAQALGLLLLGEFEVPLPGEQGNREFFLHLQTRDGSLAADL